MEAPRPCSEATRLATLQDYHILDTPEESAFNDIAKLLSILLDAPMALISFVDHDRQWFKAKHGIDATETPRSVAFCAHAILDTAHPLIVEDARQDKRFKDNPLVQGAPHIRFYAGHPLCAPNGEALGTLCAIDSKPKKLTANQQEALSVLAQNVVQLLELHKAKQEQQVLHDQLQATNHALEGFAHMAAHDLKSPLNTLGGFLKLAQTSQNLEDIRPLLDRCLLKKNQMTALIDQLLTFAKCGGQGIELTPVDLNATYHHALENIEAQIQEKGAHITCAPLPTVMGDGTLLGLLFQNLMSNAIKFNHTSPPKLSITCQEQANNALIAFQDNGIGMAAQDHTKIFDPLIRLHAKSQYEGSGLGLSTCKSIVERLNGTLTVTSHPNQGSTFRVTLPLYQGEATNP